MSKETGKFVVYKQNHGRTPMGIHFREVVIHKDLAFVHTHESKQADILPADHVFDTHDEAEKYLAGEGLVRWVVGEMRETFSKLRAHYQYRVPMMFKAKVSHYTYGGRYRKESRVAVERLSDGRNFTVAETYGFRTYKSRREAEKEFRARWQNQVKYVRDSFEADKKHLEELLKVKPRSGKKKAR